jgi:DNA-binding transcriptional LysR family regulator
MVAVPLGPWQRSAVVGSPAFVERHPVLKSPHDLRSLPCIRYRFSSGALYRWEFERGGIELDVDVSGPLTLSNQTLMVEAAVAGVGLAYVFEEQAERALALGSLVRVLADWCPDYPGFFLYYPSRRQLPGPLRALVDFAKAPSKGRRH